MKKINIIIVGFLLITSAGCKKFLDVNKNPNGPSSADPALYLPSIQTNFASAFQFDARGLGPYTQNFLNSATGAAWDMHGYSRSSDFGGEMWRTVYWKSGMNTIDVINAAREQKKWDILGAGLALQAFGWQMLTDLHGPIILKQAFDPAKNTFDYDPQDTTYAYVKRLCMEALTELDKTTDAVGSPLFTKFDLIYKGDRLKWKKFVYGILAINEHHKMLKPGYDASAVINYVDQSFASNSDDALVPFNGTNSADGNFFGPQRGNMGIFGQSAFIVRLLNGTVFSVTDPRLPLMLNPSTDGTYRGLTAGLGQSSAVSSSAAGVRSMWGTLLGTNTTAATTPSKYLFQNNAPFPLMTYAMLQFIKAEAALKKTDNTTAFDAYKKGLNAHLDFVRDGAKGPGATPGGATYPFTTDPLLISAFNTQKATYLANPAVVPAAAASLTLSQIMLQKYIALWGYGTIETWTDLRKYDYDPNIFTSFSLPTTFFPDNNNKPVYRVRPRYNSEYIWNIDALNAIGGFEPDYHTRKLWIHE
jgi:hypothetical protein